MEKEKIIRWKGSEKGGTFKIVVSGSTLTYEIVSGSCIWTYDLLNFFWFSEEMEDVRKLASSLTRKGPWRVESHQGMSGSTNWWIEYLDDFGIVRETRSIVHDSMNNKSNIKIECWIKDLYDLLWYFKENQLFIDKYPHDGCEFKDITESVISRREYFKSHSFNSDEGYVHESHLINEDKLYE